MARPNSSETLFLQTQESILSGKLQPGQRLPSERALAQEYSISRASVQAAITKLESFGLIQREPNCRPIVVSQTARPAAATSKGQVAVWIQPDVQDFGAATILEGIRATLSQTGHHLLVGCPPSADPAVEQRSEANFLRNLASNPSIAGAIVWETGGPEFLSAYRALAKANIPVVFIDREPPAEVEADIVESNNRLGAKRLVQHLISLGHRKIMMIVNDERASSVRDRIRGYREALREAEIPFRADYLVEWDEQQRAANHPQRIQALDDLLKMVEPPTAIFVVNDYMAMNLREDLLARGIRIPQDLSIAGFDWLLRWLPAGGDLTTVSQPFRTIGQVAAECLLARIQQKSQYVARQIQLDCPVVVRGTTAAPRPAPRLDPSEPLIRRTQ